DDLAERTGAAGVARLTALLRIGEQVGADLTGSLERMAGLPRDSLEEVTPVREPRHRSGGLQSVNEVKSSAAHLSGAAVFAADALTQTRFGALTPVLAALLPERPARRRATRRELLAAGCYGSCAELELAALQYAGLMLPIVGFGILLV